MKELNKNQVQLLRNRTRIKSTSPNKETRLKKPKTIRQEKKKKRRSTKNAEKIVLQLQGVTPSLSLEGSKKILAKLLVSAITKRGII